MTIEAHARQKRLVEMSLIRVGRRNNEKPLKGENQKEKKSPSLKTC